jgi:N-acetylmuramoyl-L-alanine amidase
MRIVAYQNSEIMRILLDNGHGENTRGKHSPDKRVREWAYTREVVHDIAEYLGKMGHDVYLVTPEDRDVPLAERVRRVNEQCKLYGAKNCLLISVHLNAAGGDGKWHSAQGFSAHVARNASSSSKRLAQLLWTEAIKNGMKGNRCVPPEKYIVQNLAMCRDTNCPAVLTENMFQDNRDDVEFLLGGGIQNIIRTHVDAILKYKGNA